MRNSSGFCKKQSSKGCYTHQTRFCHCSISSFPFQPRIHMKGFISKLLSSLRLDKDAWVGHKAEVDLPLSSEKKVL